jgi:hypothetical protein
MRIAALNETRNLNPGTRRAHQTAVISSALKTRSIEIGGSDPQSNLSAMLSTHADFVSHGRAGWALKEKEPSSASAVGSDSAEGAAPRNSALVHSNSPATGS